MKTFTLKMLFLSLTLIPIFLFGQTTPGIDIGDNFVVFEAEVAGYPSGEWKLFTPTDADYEKYVTSPDASGVEPVNQTYLQYTGGWNPSSTYSEDSMIQYTFVAPKTGDYQLAARLHQPLLDGDPGDESNDFYVKLTGNFESGTSAFTKSELEVQQKFWGRGINQWGTAQYLIHSNFPIYSLTQGEQYTLSLIGRSNKSCIDFIILFDPELRLSVNSDLAENPALYLPGGWDALKHKVAKIVLESSKTGIKEVGDTHTFTYKIFPSTAIDKSLTWTSSNESVATVDQNGVLTTLSEGKTIITVASNDGGAVSTNEVNVGKYIETFDSYSSSDFTLKEYVGDNGNTWQMRAKSSLNLGSTTSIQINKGVVGVRGDNIPGGIASFSVRVKNFFQTDQPHITTLLINDVEVGSIERTQIGIYDFTVENINVAGDFSLKLKNSSGEGTTKTYATLYDDLTWTPFNATASTEDVKKSFLKIFPNPTSTGRIEIASREISNISTISVFDIAGREMPILNYSRDQVDTILLDVNQLNSGVYILQLKGDNSIYTSRFVINK